jgi:hypothetical protein
VLSVPEPPSIVDETTTIRGEACIVACLYYPFRLALDGCCGLIAGWLFMSWLTFDLYPPGGLPCCRLRVP